MDRWLGRLSGRAAATARLPCEAADREPGDTGWRRAHVRRLGPEGGFRQREIAGGGHGVLRYLDQLAIFAEGAGDRFGLSHFILVDSLNFVFELFGATRTYLDQNPAVNVIVWSWCGQVDGTEAEIQHYIDLMEGLENDYPGVTFVYMTGHTDGAALTGNVPLRNKQIRDYCLANNKALYDFADIESYDPDGDYFGDKLVNDACDYDSDGNGVRDSNWAIIWQNAHPGEWYDCESAHSQPLNANLKAYAAWHLWARIAGWDGN